MAAAKPLILIAIGGAIAGTLDIVFACAFWAIKANVAPQRILQAIAAGVLGKASFQGGIASAALGLTLHFVIATAMSATYWLMVRNQPYLLARPWRAGAAFGLAAYVVMSFAVVPLSAAGAAPKDTLWITLSVLAHVLLVGIPIALFARRAGGAAGGAQASA